jgi:site-specific DNA-methyltransferase (adenine-specific)
MPRFEIAEYGNRYNVWKYSTGKNYSTKDSIAFQHPAIFPEELAEDHILTWSNEGDIVLDPMVGSGTTSKMSKMNNRNFIGFDINQDYIDISNERLKGITPYDVNNPNPKVSFIVKR